MDLRELSFIDLVREDLGRVESLLQERPIDQHEAIGWAVDHLVEGGGKRLRPALVLLSAHLCRADLDQAVFAAAAVETLHTATLIHDDLIDGALVRRGIGTLNARWPPGATILTGDYIFAYAAYLASRADNVRLMQRFAETLMVICNGEVHQMFDGEERVGQVEYERRIYAKTASLIAMSAETGAILTGADERTVHALRTYGGQLGLAFQIVDDVLDFVADEGTLGKPVGSDLRQRLVTLPLLIFLEAEPDHPVVDRVLNGDFSDEAVQRVVQTVVESPAIERALDLARLHAEQAKKALCRLQTSSLEQRQIYVDALLDLADFTVRRRF